MSPLPAVRVDCHAHVYDRVRFPLHHSSGYDAQTNEMGSAEQFAQVLSAHGLTHGLLVNPLGGYGTDNSCLLDVLGRYQGRFKGVALVAHGTPEHEFERMAAAGVIGLRFNLNFPTSPGLSATGAERTLRIARDLGWFAQVHFEGDTLIDALPILRGAGLPVVVDHCGRPDTRLGMDQPGFKALLALGRQGQAVVKLSSVFRFSSHPYAQADDYIGALVDAFTIDRCVWGSDWPFLRAKERIDHAGLLFALERWFPDPVDREKVLSHNPVRLFGFGAGH